MRPLLLFLLRYYYIFMFLLLEFIAFVLIVRHNYYHQSIAFNTARNISGSILNLSSGITAYFSLKKTNDVLAVENAMLRSMLPSSYIKSGNTNFVINDSLYQQQYSYISARVINNSINRPNNYIILNKGRAHGVKKEMGVIGPQGVIGIVQEVSTNFCTVYSLLHSKTKISAKVQKNESIGTIVWEGGDARMAVMTDVPTHVDIAAGDTIISSGYSMVFPEGLKIGTIYYYTIDKGKDFYIIKVKLFTDFNNLKYVYIVNNLVREEIEMLNKKSGNEE